MQLTKARLSASLGPSFYRLSDAERGTGLAGYGGVRWRVHGRLSLMAGGTLWTEHRQVLETPFPVTQSWTQYIVDAGFEFTASSSMVRPFVGGGAGLVLARGVLPNGIAPYLALGMEWRISPGIGIRAESRLRGFGPTQGRALEASFGLALH